MGCPSGYWNYALELAYVEFGHTARALIYLVADRTRHIELDNGGAFWTSSVHSARLSCGPRKGLSSSATHTHAENTMPIYKLRRTN